MIEILHFFCLNRDHQAYWLDAVYVEFLWMFLSMSMCISSQKHASRYTSDSKLYVHIVLYNPFQSVFPPHTRCSQDRPWIHSDQDKDECMSYTVKTHTLN